MSDPVRVVLVGCGGISGAWLRPATTMPDIQFVGLVDINKKATDAKAQEYKLDTAAQGTDLKEMLKQTKPDAVFDCTLPEIHHSVTMTALKHGCHVLGEKPLADTMAHAREMVAAAEQAKKTYAVIQNRRYDPRIRSLRRFLDSGRIGQVTTVNADFYIGAHFGGFRDQMQHVLLLDMAIHSFDQARLISGADPVAVYCHEWNPFGSWYAHGASAIAIFEMSNGLRLIYRGSWCAEGMNTTWECDWRAIGTNGSVKWDGADKLDAEVVVKTGGFFSEKEKLSIPVEPDGKETGHAGLIREFIDCVKHGGTPETIASDNIKSLAMVFGAIESAETGKRVEIKV